MIKKASFLALVSCAVFSASCYAGQYAQALGDCVYRYRKKRNMTQAALEESTGVTEQTIRKIEHGEGNLQLDVLSALIEVLQIDPTEIFYPSETADAPARKQLEIMLSDCSDDQIASLIPIVSGALEVVKGKKLNAIK